MLDLQYICDHRDAVRENCRVRGVDVDIDALIALRDERNARIAQADELRHRQKDVSSQIPRASDDERPELIE